MKHFEYMTLVVDMNDETSKNSLDYLGSQRWEAIHIENANADHPEWLVRRFYFKRELEVRPPPTRQDISAEINSYRRALQDIIEITLRPRIRGDEQELMEMIRHCEWTAERALGIPWPPPPGTTFTPKTP